jgi:hypothetical protein
VPATEPLVSTLARKYKLDINTGTELSPTWTQVKAIAEFKPTIDASTEDDSDYDGAGWGSDAKTLLKWKIELKIIRKITVDTAAYDPGQEALRGVAEDFGPDGVVHVRWYDRDGSTEAWEGFGEVTWEPDGGDTTALATVSVNLMGRGAREVITNPAA